MSAARPDPMDPVARSGSVSDNKISLGSASLQDQSTRSYASVAAEASPITPESEQNQSMGPDNLSEAENADIESGSEQKQPIGLLERYRMQIPKKPTYYYWPSSRHFPVLEEPSAPMQPPTTLDGVISIPEIIISEQPSSPPPTSSALTPTRRMDSSKLTPRAIPRAKVTRKSSDGSGTASPAQSRDANEIAPKPSLFSYNLCTDPKCPISRPHDKGIFYHGDEDRFFLEIDMSDNGTSQPPFGPSNPPPEVWDAWDRVTGCRGSVRDVRIVEGFQAAHGAMRMWRK